VLSFKNNLWALEAILAPFLYIAARGFHLNQLRIGPSIALENHGVGPYFFSKSKTPSMLVPKNSIPRKS
jgi:hypothetical protein